MFTTRNRVAGALGFVLLGMQSAEGVAFKVHNQSTQKFRMRVHDQKDWLDWVETPPGFWGVTAPKVKRTDHDVEIDVWITSGTRRDPGWIPFYRGRHGSKVFTRVIHLFEYVQPGGEHVLVMGWYDERPGCRDKPMFENGEFRNGCLVRSGWTDDLLKHAARKVGETALRLILAGW